MKAIDASTIKYKNNYLKNVIFRVDIAPILSINEKIDAKFQDSIRSMFPKFEIKTATQVRTEYKDGKPSSQADLIHQYVFQNEEKTNKLTISSEFIILEILKFQGIRDLKSKIQDILKNFDDIYSPISVNRLGLRYINEIVFPDGSPFDWNGYIKEDLISVLDSELVVKGETSRIMSQMIYQKEDYNVTFSFGIVNSEYPNPISRKEFILDFDCYTTDAEFDKISRYIDEYNDCAVQLFENSIEDGLRAKLSE